MKKWVLVGIVSLGFFLRIIGLSSHPAGFTPDEASFGYDAYSILKTGKDQWGYTLPLVFKSFGDDKLPVYTYLAAPSVAIFGLNEFAVRLPNAILGSLAILVVYFLTKELFKNEKLALFSSFMLVVSPWHIMLSRGAFEANLTTFFLPLGMLFFLKSFRSGAHKIKYLILSIVILLINIFTYHTARLLTPFILFFMIFSYCDGIKKARIFGLASFFAIGLLAIGLFGYLYGGSRIASSSILGINYSGDRYLAQAVGEVEIIAKLFYNKPIYIVRQFIINYFSYFSPQFLFTTGPAEGTYGMVPGIGVLFLVELPLIICFLIKIIKEKVTKENLLLLFWVLVAPIPASLTSGPGYAGNRTAFMMPAIEVISAIGGIYLWQNVKKYKYSKILLCCFIVIFLLNIVYVGEKYFVAQTVEDAPSMIYGARQIVSGTSNFSGNIVVSKSISEPQIYFAFYTGMDPAIYQESSKNWQLVNGWVDQEGMYSLGKYTFRNINYSADANLANTLLIGTPNDFPAEIKSYLSVNYPNLKPAYYIVQTK